MKKVLACVLALMLLVSFSTPAQAWGHGRGWGWGHGGGWGWFGGGVAAGLVAGAVIASLPPRATVVYVGGVPYYYDGVTYYQTVPNGYVVVAPPTQVVVQQAPPPIEYHLQNVNGSVTVVTIQRDATGAYVGPKGDRYSVPPTADQLRAVYGK